jgi:hypothetical protein
MDHSKIPNRYAWIIISTPRQDHGLKFPRPHSCTLVHDYTVTLVMVRKVVVALFRVDKLKNIFVSFLTIKESHQNK